MKAYLKNYRQSPRKVSLITSLISGKKVKEAEVILSRLIKRGALPISKLLKSAIANSKINNKISDVSKMPYYIKEDWIRHNTKRLNILTINEHIKEISTNSINDDEKLIEELKIIRRDLIIKGII